MLHSKKGFAKKPKPSSGRLVIMIGTIAQWIAQSTEAVIPMLSNFEECFARAMVQMY